MGIDTLKLYINSSLDKIIRGEDIENSVETVVDNMKIFLSAEDNVLLHMRGREQSRYLHDSLDYLELNCVGNYSVYRKRGKDKRVVSFCRSPFVLDFCFVRRDLDILDPSLDTLKSSKLDEKDLEAVINKNLLKVGKGGSPVHQNEILLGENSRDLGGFSLGRVDLVKEVPSYFFGLVPYMKKLRETVYSND